MYPGRSSNSSSYLEKTPLSSAEATLINTLMGMLYLCTQTSDTNTKKSRKQKERNKFKKLLVGSKTVQLIQRKKKKKGSSPFEKHLTCK